LGQRIETLARHAPRFLPHLAGHRRIVDKPAQRPGQRGRIAGRHEDAGASVLDRFADAGVMRRHNRRAARHRLDHDIRQTFRIATDRLHARHADSERAAHLGP
jgi:hypothetical protein